MKARNFPKLSKLQGAETSFNKIINPHDLTKNKKGPKEAKKKKKPG